MPFSQPPAFHTTLTKRIEKEVMKWSLTDQGYTLFREAPGLAPGSLRIVFLGPPDSLYSSETFTLRIRFPTTYPFSSPEIMFDTSTGNPSPVHEHIYTNGHICLSILSSEWSPALTVQSCVLSIVSMLSTSRGKVRPEGDEDYCRRVGSRSPLETSWIYHDDDV